MKKFFFPVLQILCAGVWHNVVLMLIAFAIGISLPFIMSPFYKTGSGIFILNLDQVTMLI